VPAFLFAPVASSLRYREDRRCVDVEESTGGVLCVQAPTLLSSSCSRSRRGGVRGGVRWGGGCGQRRFARRRAEERWASLPIQVEIRTRAQHGCDDAGRSINPSRYHGLTTLISFFLFFSGYGVAHVG
jgi:hypothetical protein